MDNTGPLLDGTDEPAARTVTALSLRAAVEALCTAPARVSSVSLSGRLPRADELAPLILTIAERLALERGLALDLHLEAGLFELRFRR